MKKVFLFIATAALFVACTPKVAETTETVEEVTTEVVEATGDSIATAAADSTAATVAPEVQ